MVNKVFLIGNLGKDPEVRYTASGMAVCNLSLATTRKWTDKDGTAKESTQWHSVTAWGRMGENCSQYLQKGRQVFVEGRLEYQKWTDKQGAERIKAIVTAERIQFLGGGPRTNDDDARFGGNEKLRDKYKAATGQAPEREPGGDDDVPHSGPVPPFGPPDDIPF